MLRIVVAIHYFKMIRIIRVMNINFKLMQNFKNVVQRLSKSCIKQNLY